MSVRGFQRVVLILHVVIPLIVFALLFACWGGAGLVKIVEGADGFWVALFGFFMSLPIHELIHYLCLISFGGVDPKDVRIGVNRRSLTLFVSCGVGVGVARYMVSVIAPFVSLGIVSLFAAILFRSFYGVIFSVLVMLSCAGDLVMFFMLFGYGLKDVVARRTDRIGFFRLT